MSRHPRGIGLAETVVAIFILVAGITSSLSLLFYIFTTSALTREQIVAINLAREGIEIVRNIRDSNWVFYGEGGARQYWNRSFNSDVAGVYIGILNPLDATADADLDDGASLQRFHSRLDVPLTDTLANEKIYEVDIGGETFLTQQPDVPGAIPTRFSRRITIDYVNSDGSGASPVTDDNIILVTSTVQYQSKSEVKSVSLSARLTDWYKRTDHSL